MHAIEVEQTKSGPQLVWRKVEEPVLQAGEALVSINATTLNRADLSQAAGNYPPPPGAPDIMGLDMSGEIAAVGADVEGWQVGDKVCALLAGGGYAERVAVDQRLLIPIPTGWSFEEAACLPEVYLTAFVNIFMEAGFQPGETILIHGGASGVGTAAIQLVKGAGGRVITTAGRPDKVETCLEQGADLAINYRTEDFAARTREFTQGAGVDVILDMVGAEYLERNISLLKLKGRLVFIATLSGAEAMVDIRQLMGKRAPDRLGTARTACRRKSRNYQAFSATVLGTDRGRRDPSRHRPGSARSRSPRRPPTYGSLRKHRQNRAQSALSSSSSVCTASSIAASPVSASVTSRS